jgi:hypothetical protein
LRTLRKITVSGNDIATAAIMNASIVLE